MPRRRGPRAPATLLAALAFTTACGGGGAAGRPAVAEVRVGVLAPLSGPGARTGRDVLRGAELAADVVNTARPGLALPLAAGAGLPRLGGAKVAIVPGDTAGDPRAAAALGARLVVADGAAVLVGADDAEVTLAASQRAERLPAPFVDASTATDFLSDRGLDWYFHVGPTARTYGAAFLSLLARQDPRRLPGRRLAVVFADDRAGNDAANATSVLAGDGGYTVAASVRFDPAATDLRGTVEAVRAADPDAVLAAPTAATAGVLLEAFRAVGYRPPALLVYDAQAVPAETLARAGPTAVGLCRPVTWSAELAGRNPLARSVAAAYQQRFQEPMTEAAARGFTAVLAAAQAVDEAGSTGPDQVRTALLALDVAPLDVVMPWNGIHFDATRQNSGAGAVVEQYVGGRFQVVYPPDMTVHDLAWPAAAPR